MSRNSCRLRLSTAVLLLAVSPVVARGAEAVDAAKVRFNRDIRPILSDKCFKCHGPSEEAREAGLRLDTAEGATAKLESGSMAIAPGAPEKSELVRRITSGDEFVQMPPPDSGKKLSAEEIELLTRWVRQGAEYQGHWSFITPRRPAIPKVQREAWPRGAIDYFVLARLEEEGLEPNPPADRRTLIRRVTLDLTGLPPRPEDVEAFVNDSSMNAYEQVVDRLLDSPHYGEHLARYWLDAARYGDTHGLHLDNYREMWPYRDWVIRAFNDNMPFDRFTIEQLAGDLLPNPTLDQQLASGFNRCNVTTSEGGSIVEEVYVRNVIDRVETTGTVFMGATLGCAVCHNHKFDPYTMRDFYQVFAFFNSLDGNAMDGNRKDHPPVVKVPLPGQQEQIADFERRIAAVQRQLEARKAAVAGEFQKWLAAAEKGSDAAVEVTGGLIAHYRLDEGKGTAIASAVEAPAGAVQGKVDRVAGKLGGALKFGGGFVKIGDVGRFERTDRFSYGAWVKTPGNGNGTPLARMDDARGHRGWDLYVAGKRVAMHLIHHWSGNALKVTSKAEVLKPNVWHHVFVTYDGSSKASGVRIYVDGRHVPHGVDVDSLQGTTITETPLQLGKRNPGSPFQGGAIDDVRIYNRTLSPEEVAALAGGDPIGPILAIARDKRTPEQQQALLDYFLNNVDTAYRELAAKREQLRSQKTAVEKQFATSLVFKERENPRPAFILKRGQYDQRGEQVQRDTPAFLPPMPEDVPRNRLGFAKWLVSPEHPLMSRVTVNRFWQQCFGIGIVKTSEDFGSQGEWPSHPDLLDWLAVDFRESGWDVKRLMKMIVMSSTYRQSSAATQEAYQHDPENRLLARGPRHRLDAETLRDQALAVSGLLVRKVGGPSVKPPQPGGIWNAVGYTSSNTANFKQDQAPKIYRRSVYTFWKRTAPPPAMRTFDAPSRESCRVRRERTNTPLQALLMMNDRQYFEAARHLAQRAMHEAGETPESRASFMFRLATARRPAEDELKRMLDLFEENLAEFSQDSAAAESVIKVGDTQPDPSLAPARLASWTMVANMILNLDEVVTKN